MITIKLSYSRLKEMDACLEKANLKGRAFSIFVARAKKEVKKELASFNDALTKPTQEQETELSTFNSLVSKINSDSDLNIDQKNIKLKEVNEEFDNLLKEVQGLNEEYDQMLKKEVEFVLPSISEKDIPEDASANLIDGFIELIEA